MTAFPAVAQTTSPPATPPADCTPAEDDAPAESPDPDAPEAVVAASEVSQADIADEDKGIRFSGAGFTPNGKATVTVVGTDGTKYQPKLELTVNDDGEVNGTYFFTATEDAKVPTGTYTLYLTDLTTETASSKVKFDVVEKTDETQAPLPTSTECATESTAPETAPETTEPETTAPETTAPETSAPATQPPTATAGPPKPTTTTSPETSAPETSAPETSAPETSSPETTAPETTAPETSAPETTSPEASSPETSAPAPSESAAAAPETSASESAGGQPAAEARAASIAIDPTEISSADFGDDDKGVTVQVSDAVPGEKLTLVVEHAQGKVERFTTTKNADDDGSAVFGVHAATDPVLGEYRVTVFGTETEAMNGSFTAVTNGTSVGDEAEGGSGSGSDDSGSGSGSGSGSDSQSSGSDLPRTGSEITGLALGAGLLVVGAAAVVITRRRAASSAQDASGTDI